MMKKFLATVGVIGVVAASPVLAVDIPVGNASFEATDLTDGELLAHQNAPGIEDWTVDGPANSAGILDMTAIAANSPFNFPDAQDAFDGENVLWINGDDGSFANVSQMVGETAQMGWMYTLTAQVAYRQNADTGAALVPDNYKLEILAGDDVIATALNPVTLSGTSWEEASVSIEIMDSMYVGEELGVRLSADSIQPLFDDISFTGVPEPASLSLLAMGGLMLLRRRRTA
jgi:hypothetical protein